mgnify:CR=1 FL=1
MANNNLKNIVSEQSDTVKKIEKLSFNEEKKSQGEAIIGISPYDDYFLFNIFKEVDGHDLPVDITGIGTLYLNFIDGDQEIKIANTINVDGVQPHSGQVVFKISKEQSRIIINFKNNNFYISSRMNSNGDHSDESVIYTGKFYSFDKMPEVNFTQQYDALKKSKDTKILEIENENKQLTSNNLNLQKSLNLLADSLKKLEDLNSKLNSIIDKFKNKLSSTDQAQINQILEQQEITKKEIGITEDQIKDQLIIKKDQFLDSKNIEYLASISASKSILNFSSKDNTSKQ